MNFKKLPIVKECEVIKDNAENVSAYMKEMDKAFELAVKNDVSHIRKLSEAVSQEKIFSVQCSEDLPD